MTSTLAFNFYQGSFMCGASGSATCLDCHPSCSGCTAGKCNSCVNPQATKAADGGFCLCTASGCPTCHASCSTCGGSNSNQCTDCTVKNALLSDAVSGGTCACGSEYVPQSPAVAICAPPCHESCLTCSVNNSASACLTCKATGAGLDNAAGGTCSCGDEYVPQTSPTTCEACHGTCSRCVNSSVSGCTECKIPEAKTSNAAGGTCSCPSQYVPQSPATSSCVSCQLSCLTCTNNSASGCLLCKVPEATLDNPLGGTCACTAPKYKGKTSPTTPCEPLCSPSCATCANPTSEGCLTCKVPEASVTKAGGGVCYCGSGYVREFNPTTSCRACAQYDCVCSGLKGTPCLGPELQDFVTFAAGYGLPLVTPGNGAWCFGSSMPVSARQISEVEAVIGPISRDGSGNLQPSPECYDLLRAQWTFIDDWFKLLFSRFSAPAAATAAEIYNTKGGLRLWIFRFGGSSMYTKSEWGPIRAAFNTPGAQLSDYLAWADGYSIDRKTVLNYPNSLKLALKEQDKALFNRFSTVCREVACKLKTQCQQVDATSICATS